VSLLQKLLLISFQNVLCDTLYLEIVTIKADIFADYWLAPLDSRYCQ